MHGAQLLNVLVLALSTASAAQALKIDTRPAANHGGFQLAARQKTSANGDANTSPTGQAANTTPSSSTTIPSTSSPAPTTSKPESSTSSPSPSTTPPTTKPTTSDDPPESTSNTTPTPSPTPSPTSDKPDTTSTTPAPESTTTTRASNTSNTSLVTSTSTLVVTTTDAAGHSTTYTTSQLSTSTPGLASAGQSNNSTGMTPQTRNTVIGVVVGVGGAIVLAGIAFLALRLYRKKAPEEGDGLMEYNSGFVAATDKSEVASSTTGAAPSTTRTPFQSTLESYHAPTQVNTASNF